MNGSMPIHMSFNYVIHLDEDGEADEEYNEVVESDEEHILGDEFEEYDVDRGPEDDFTEKDMVANPISGKRFRKKDSLFTFYKEYARLKGFFIVKRNSNKVDGGTASTRVAKRKKSSLIGAVNSTTQMKVEDQLDARQGETIHRSNMQANSGASLQLGASPMEQYSADSKRTEQRYVHWIDLRSDARGRGADKQMPEVEMHLQKGM
ncbi:hypothetical protein HAX54_036246 [Datura stramonium]|uniref:Protein FAR1-RELATED SEQUENCE n=1 Tax=Datura stramonium TaxID=4076 RepID=A0ABS8SG15_DATST|nr:hypothetical protein [Datura stramonium]